MQQLPGRFQQPCWPGSGASDETGRGAGLPAQEADDSESALASIRLFELPAPPRVLITGSLYLAGVVLALVKDAVTLYRQEWCNGRRGFVRTVLVCCHRCLVNVAIYAERVRRER